MANSSISTQRRSAFALLSRLSSGKLARPRLDVLAPVISYVVPPVAAVLLAATIWQVVVDARQVPTYIIPTPLGVMGRLLNDFGFFAREGAFTLAEAMSGFVIGCFVALVAAVFMAHSRFLERSILPLAILIKVTPIVAVAPLFVIWFGFGVTPKILIAALITFFPTLVNGVTGFRSVDQGALDFLRSLNASDREVFFKLRLPSAMPYLFAAFRVSIPLSVIGAVVGEWFSANRGLGSVIMVANSNLDTTTLFGAVFTLAFIGISLTILVAVLEKNVLFWHESSISDKRKR